jgi:hypothetical protein
MNWKEARESAGMKQDQVWIAWNVREMPASIRRELSRSKWQRLENGGSAKLSPIAKAHLADLIGVRLSEIDPAAAAEYTELMQDTLISTWMTATSGDLVAA